MAFSRDGVGYNLCVSLLIKSYLESSLVLINGGPD